jgi:hypothetical protein
MNRVNTVQGRALASGSPTGPGNGRVRSHPALRRLLMWSIGVPLAVGAMTIASFAGSATPAHSEPVKTTPPAPR